MTPEEAASPDDPTDLAEDQVCHWCGGDGFAESTDPFWDGWDKWGNPALIDCPCCGGSGDAKDCTFW